MNPFPHRFSTALATADLPNPVGPSSTKTFFPSSKAFWMLSKACNCPRRGCIAGGKNLCIPLKPPPLKGGIANLQTHVTCFAGAGAQTIVSLHQETGRVCPLGPRTERKSKALTLTPQNKSEVGIGLFPRSQDGAPPGCHHLSELLSNQKRLPLGDWPILAFDLSRPNSHSGCPTQCAFQRVGTYAACIAQVFYQFALYRTRPGQSQNLKKFRASSPVV